MLIFWFTTNKKTWNCGAPGPLLGACRFTSLTCLSAFWPTVDPPLLHCYFVWPFEACPARKENPGRWMGPEDGCILPMYQISQCIWTGLMLVSFPRVAYSWGKGRKIWTWRGGGLDCRMWRPQGCLSCNDEFCLRHPWGPERYITYLLVTVLKSSQWKLHWDAMLILTGENLASKEENCPTLSKQPQNLKPKSINWWGKDSITFLQTLLISPL